MIPNILSIAGSDPSGGAGIQADLKAISANGGYAMAAITALTVQNTTGVTGAQLIEPDFVSQQINAVFDDIDVHAVKVGMLGSVAITEAVAQCLKNHKDTSIQVVVDPVMVAKGGDRLLAQDAVGCLRDVLLPCATLITPNLPEAADLLNLPVAESREVMREHAQQLLDLGPQAVLLKGGHLVSDDSPDLLLGDGIEQWFEAPRLPTRNTHGTGCTLSAALACQLARQPDMISAVQQAKHYIHAAIAAADDLNVGRGIGPVDHFFTMRN